jgi:hypothetical protein
VREHSPYRHLPLVEGGRSRCCKLAKYGTFSAALRLLLFSADRRKAFLATPAALCKSLCGFYDIARSVGVRPAMILAVVTERHARHKVQDCKILSSMVRSFLHEAANLRSQRLIV